MTIDKVDIPEFDNLFNHNASATLESSSNYFTFLDI